MVEWVTIGAVAVWTFSVGTVMGAWSARRDMGPSLRAGRATPRARAGLGHSATITIAGGVQ